MMFGNFFSKLSIAYISSSRTVETKKFAASLLADYTSWCSLDQAFMCPRAGGSASPEISKCNVYRFCFCLKSF